MYLTVSYLIAFVPIPKISRQSQLSKAVHGNAGPVHLLKIGWRMRAVAPMQLVEDHLRANPPAGSKVTAVSLESQADAYFMPKESVSNQAALKVKLCTELPQGSSSLHIGKLER